MTDNPFVHGYQPPEPDPVETFHAEPEPARPSGPMITEPAIRTGRVVYYHDLQQGSMDWHNARLGLLTASEMKLILTPTLKIASNEKERTHLYELLAQRVTKYVEPTFQSYDMERGNFDEEHAREKYSEKYAPVTECGFITNSRWGFTLGCSPDGLVADDEEGEGGIEIKSRIQKWQMQTLIESVARKEIPADFIMQVQSELLISERNWWDFVSYSGGMLMATVRAYPDPVIHNAIIEAAGAFEARLAEKLEIYNDLIASDARLIPTERLLQL